jgi:phage tail P2-like protein
LTDGLLPPNARALERAAESVAVQALRAIPHPHRQLWNADSCPLQVLPWLAWAMGVEGWRPEWPERVKRAVVRNAIAIQRRRGTHRSVADAVAAFGANITIREWWQTVPRGIPHTFELILNLTDQTGAGVTAEFIENVIAEVTRVKPLRSHFTAIQGLVASASTRTIAVGRMVAYARLDLQIR